MRFVSLCSGIEAIFATEPFWLLAWMLSIGYLAALATLLLGGVANHILIWLFWRDLAVTTTDAKAKKETGTNLEGE